MNVSISSLSKHLTRIEDEVGVPLFERSTRTVRLNDYGKIFLDYALKCIEQKQRCITSIHSQMQKESAQLNIGLMPICQLYGIPDFICDFNIKYPEIKIQMNEKRHMADFFKTDQCDFVFADIQHLNGIETDSFELLSDHMVVVMSKDNPLASKECLELTDLRDENFIVNGESENSLSRSTIEFSEKAQLAGFVPNIRFVSSSYTTIVSLASRGYGVSVINKGLIPRHYLKHVAIVELNANFSFSIYCLYRKDRARSPYFDMFLKFVRKNAPFNPDDLRKGLE